MIYGSVCSGIEAATVAWHPLGWEPEFFAEIEPFPNAVLSHHYPTIPNLGDMTGHAKWKLRRAIDLLVGGTPCQDFSIAGLRKGFAGARGSLTVEFVRILEQLRPRWFVYENVPGMLSIDEGRGFGTFLDRLAGIGYRYAYRVFDAQYFGLAQRRERVFVVGYLGDWRPPAAVLIEPECLRRNPAPRRETGQEIAGTIGGSSQSGGFRTTDLDNHGAFIPFHGQQITRPRSAMPSAGDLAFCLPASDHPQMIAHAIQERATCENPDAGPDGIGVRGDDCAFTLEARSTPQSVAYSIANRWKGDDGRGYERGHNIIEERAPTLDATKPPAVAMAFPWDQWDCEFEPSDQSPSLCGNHNPPAAMAGSMVRRMTPREYERLQGFPDDYTLIPQRGRLAADSPRYKAIGNSMPVPVMRWIGERIQMVDAMVNE